MLKFTTKGIYGIMILLDLAGDKSGTPQSISQISARTHISAKYSEQIITQLKKTEYISSFRGKNGGYKLALSPKDINIGKALLFLEGSFAPVKCISEGDQEDCDRKNICITRLFWQKLHNEISDVIDSITLAELYNDFLEWGKSRNNMYYI